MAEFLLALAVMCLAIGHISHRQKLDRLEQDIREIDHEIFWPGSQKRYRGKIK